MSALMASSQCENDIAMQQNITAQEQQKLKHHKREQYDILLSNNNNVAIVINQVTPLFLHTI